jgi:hypothetical protein
LEPETFENDFNFNLSEDIFQQECDLAARQYICAWTGIVGLSMAGT